MSEVGERIVAEARRWEGTPFRPLARERGSGCDCAGLLIGVMRDLKLLDYDDRQYGPAAPMERVTLALERFCEPVLGDPQAGDFLVFSLRGGQPHCGVASGAETFLHAWDLPGIERVCEIPLDRWWSAHVARVYRWREDAASG